jgi:iron(III) transport system substrate-binding protein
MRTISPRPALLAIASAAVLALTAGCAGAGGQAASPASPSDDADAGATTLTIYTDQHLELVQALADAYTDQTGVTFDIQPDANFGQIEAEGDASPADLFLSEDPAPVAMLAEGDYLLPVDQATLDQVRDGLNPTSGLWVAYAARVRVLYYNPDLIDEADLPEHLADLTEDRYRGMFAYAPSGAFRASVQYLISTIGSDATASFLEQLKANGVDEQKNGNVRDTVEAGKHAMGLSNHYYWYSKAAEVGGPENMTSKIYHFPAEDPGNLVLSSGAGVLATSDHPAEAAEFLAWLTSPDGGQDLLAHAAIDVSGAQYPVAKGLASDLAGSLDEIMSPVYDMGIYANQSDAEEMLKSLGISG